MKCIPPLLVPGLEICQGCGFQENEIWHVCFRTSCGCVTYLKIVGFLNQWRVSKNNVLPVRYCLMSPLSPGGLYILHLLPKDDRELQLIPLLASQRGDDGNIRWHTYTSTHIKNKRPLSKIHMVSKEEAAEQRNRQLAHLFVVGWKWHETVNKQH